MTMRSYQYKGRPWIALLAFLLFSAMAYFNFHEAARAEHVMTFLHFVELKPDQAVYFYWVAGTGSLLGAALAMAGIFSSLLQRNYVLLGEQGIVVPTGFWGRPVEIRFTDILSLRIRRRQFQRWLEIKHMTGQVLILASLIRSQAEFDEIVQTLSARSNLAVSKDRHWLLKCLGR